MARFGTRGECAERDLYVNVSTPLLELPSLLLHLHGLSSIGLCVYIFEILISPLPPFFHLLTPPSPNAKLYSPEKRLIMSYRQ